MTHITDYGGAIDDYYPARMERIKDMDRVSKFLSTLRASHPDMVKLFTEGRCYSLFEILHSIWPQAKPKHSVSEGHIYTEIEGKLYDIRGIKYLPPSDLEDLTKGMRDPPHRWALRDTRQFVGEAQARTMLRDFAEHRRLIHTHAPIEEIEEHWDSKCERWTYCINPNQEEKK